MVTRRKFLLNSVSFAGAGLAGPIVDVGDLVKDVAGDVVSRSADSDLAAAAKAITEEYRRILKRREIMRSNQVILEGGGRYNSACSR